MMAGPFLPPESFRVTSEEMEKLCARPVRSDALVRTVGGFRVESSNGRYTVGDILGAFEAGVNAGMNSQGDLRRVYAEFVFWGAASIRSADGVRVQVEAL